MSEKDDQESKERPEVVDAENLILSMRIGRTLDSMDVQALLSQNLAGENLTGDSPDQPEEPLSGSKDEPTTSSSQSKPSDSGQKPGHKVRRVAKTLIDTDVPKNRGASPEKDPPALEPPASQTPPASEQAVPAAAQAPPAPAQTAPAPEQPDPPPAQAPPASTPKTGKTAVAKTMLYSPEDQSTPQSLPKPPAKKRSSLQFVAKTLLDKTALFKTQKKLAEREKERIQQEISQRTFEPQKLIEPIETKKKVAGCPFSWNDESEKERFKHCTNCQSTIYNLDGMDFAEAEALIFKRENRKKFALYKRDDGKFMTSDCPVAKRRRYQTAGLVAVCLCVVACIGGFIMMMPPPPPPTAESQTPPDVVTTEQQSPDETASGGTSKGGATSGAASSTGSDGGSTHHWKAGQPMPVEPEPTKQESEKTFSQADENGDFWQFSNGQ